MFQHDPCEPDFFVLVEFPRESPPPGGERLLQVPASLLTSQSPVFASMVETVWRESHDRRLSVVAFSSEDFLAFLQCLPLTGLPEALGDLALTPACARRVLPLASYYQVEALKELATDSVRRLLASSRADRVELAADLVVAIEESLPEIEHVPWDREVLGALAMRMLDVSASLTRPGYRSNHQALRTVVRFRPNDATHALTRTTLQRCIKALCLGITHSLDLDDIARISHLHTERENAYEDAL